MKRKTNQGDLSANFLFHSGWSLSRVEGRETYCTNERNDLLVSLLPGLSSMAGSLVCSIAYLLSDENRYIFASPNRMQSELRFFPLKRQISASLDLSRKINKCHSLCVNVNISRSGVLVCLACKHYVDCRHPVDSSAFSIYLSFSSLLAKDFSVDRWITCNYEACLDWDEEETKEWNSRRVVLPKWPVFLDSFLGREFLSS